MGGAAWIVAPKLACNYSMPLVELVEKSLVSIDALNLTRLEVAQEELSDALRLRPTLIHMLGSGGCDRTSFDKFDWDAVNRVLEIADPPHIAMHLAVQDTDWPGLAPSVQSRAEALAMIERLAGNFQGAARKVVRPLLFENMPYYGYRGTARIAAEPAVLWQLVEEGFGMLLDLSHLQCTAYHFGVDVRSLARSLPLHAVKELHISGPRMSDAGLHDAHDTMRDEDYDILEWILELTEPGFITLEYGGTDPEFGIDESTIRENLQPQLARLRRMIG